MGLHVLSQWCVKRRYRGIRGGEDRGEGTELKLQEESGDKERKGEKKTTGGIREREVKTGVWFPEDERAIPMLFLLTALRIEQASLSFHGRKASVVFYERGNVEDASGAGGLAGRCFASFPQTRKGSDGRCD